MYSNFRKSVLASSIALALASASGAAFAGTPCNDDNKSHQANMPGQDISEARQETQIQTTYALNSNLQANDLKVSVDGGKATLTGTVEEDVSKELANEIALGVTGIDSVDNQIKVDPDYAPPAKTAQERSFGQAVDDASITATVKSKLLWSSNADGLQMNVDTNDGKVTLSGNADSEEAKTRAATIAQNTRGVDSVDNRLVVDPTKVAAKVAKNDSGQTHAKEVSDGWITTKVNSMFLYSANVESNNIEVSTDKGIVTLTGKVDSDSERQQAIELAEHIRGVKSVNASELTTDRTLVSR